MLARMPKTMMIIHNYSDFDQLGIALASRWLKLIQDTPASQPCSFALAGGSTPAPLYRRFDQLLAAASPRSIQLLATDERWVPDSDAQSNEGLFRQCFSTSAASWSLLSLKNTQPDPDSAVADINTRLRQECPTPFAAVILGMGSDGHIASLFPDTPQLLDPTAPGADVACVAARHPQTDQARMSLSMARLLMTNAVWLVITGAEKRAVLETAPIHSPIGALLAHASMPVEVFWCP